ncbi:LysR family transcriptional regulator [Bradyrhizobium liaoningense]|uniref:LysR substrate-binding domain-containing protein n=1 Tax=Bradyrhizobium liaoningense TaxID=43992 RepID=UPI001BAC8197|nr:LysR family transcriptional regulator [Bradyrhizobium liaoningense]MBR0858052.1 LysR family transcriptional regulator [Bradyrhizobium liaoningense]
MDVRLKYVVAVAKSGSFTAAAHLVGVTQSAVTRAVADLERQIGYDLFYRTARGALLTDLGGTFAERAARLLDDEHELLKGDPRITDPFSGVLRIGVCPAMLEWALSSPIATLKTRHPRMRFEVVGGPFERMAPMLRNGGVDVVVGFDEAFKEWSDITRHPLWRLKTSLFVRKKHPLLNESSISREKMSEFEIVSPSESRPYGALIRTLYESQGVDWRKRVHIADYFPIVAHLVENSNAVGVVTTSYSRAATFRSKFDVLAGFKLWGMTPICCATGAKWELGPMARTFIAAMRAFGDPVHRPLTRSTGN